MADPTGAPFDPFAAQKAANQAQMLAKLLQEQPAYEPPQQTQMVGNHAVPFSPVAGFAGALAKGLDAWGRRKAGENAIDKQNALEKGRSQIYADAMAGKPQDEVNVSPQITQAPQPGQPGQNANFNYGGPTAATAQDLAQALTRGGDPKYAGEAVVSQMRALEPPTQYQQAELKDRADQRNYERRNADYATIDAGSDAIQKALDSSTSVSKVLGSNAAAAMKAGDEANAKLPAEKELAKIRADATASGQGEFGRSMNGKAYNILAGGLTNDAARATPEYATAWQILSNPHVDPNTGTIVTPDLSAFKPPLGAQQPPAPGQPAPAPGSPPPQRMPSVQSFAPPNPSQAEAGSAGYANRLSESSGIIDKNQDSGTSLYNRTAAALPGGNYAVGSGYQQLDQAERNFVNAQLRRESGAAISESEFQNARKQYFPQPGDKPEVLAQKKKARDMAVQNMQLSAGNVLLPPGVVQQSSPPKGAPMVPQQQGFGAQAVPQGGGAPPQRIGRFTVEPVGP